MIQYLKSHPGGLDLIVEESGKTNNETTEAFEDIGHGKDARVCSLCFPAPAHGTHDSLHVFKIILL